MVQTHHPEHIKRLYSVLNKLKQFSETITSTEREDQLADKYPDKYDSSDEAHLNRLKICSEAVKEMNEKMEVALELIKRLEARTLITKVWGIGVVLMPG
ncbi:uncharacterized protein CcaverHIS019_0411220 [Cutaneotrichosporon cavernicola]|uniref:Uncharacterized protein n=1 Tax=Cutaneotrichosporon cavernicola TaxID=279322 RepID=A0AA48L5I5_9TREE|nr:uncharacterized protein CcaverHIS019_0411220 [Cutaneotrichosporon cavernicola]BEI92302.1 hypothetical protein CcaverHIS019_0411220 [Cutaneotrichosporon cavernicola]BEJ00073.1 hypothetical protein CcaverHIS631_0411150 [Cutaneotrichosporon cavernicola]